jgi:competence protein ComEC
VFIAAAVGIVVDRWTSPFELDVRWRVMLWWAMALTAGTGWWLLYRRGHYFLSALALTLVAAGLGGAWHAWRWKAFDAADIGRSAPPVSEPCCLEVVALSHVERTAAPATSPYRAIPSGERSQLQVEVVRIRNGQQWQRACGRCQLVVDGHLLGVEPRDKLLVFCQWQANQPASNPGEFDYRLFARARRQLCTLRTDSPECVTIREPATWRHLRFLSQFNDAAQQRIWNQLDPQVAPIACAVLLGASHALPTELRDHYMVTGATHVLVVSGLHASILVGGIFLLLRMGILPRKASLAIAMILIIGYVLFTGANPPVVRAAVVAEIICVGLWMGVRGISLNSLAAAALVVLAINPAELFLTGTQLSFLCSASLIWIASVIAHRTREVDPLKQLLARSQPPALQMALSFGRSARLMLVTSMLLWLITLPLVAFAFHLLSPVSVPASLLVIPTVSLALGAGLLYLTLGGLLPWSAGPLATLCESLFWALDGIVHWTSTLPYSYAWTPGPPAWWVAGYYLILGVMLKTGGIRGGWQRLAQTMALWVIVGAAVTLIDRSRPRDMEVAFLDVGHGTSVVVITPEGRTLLYDAGGMGSPERATEAVSHYLWSRGMRKIDGVILSHADVDHYNGLPGLVDRFPVGRVFVSPHMFPHPADSEDHSAPAALQRLLVDRNIPIEEIVMGDRLEIGKQTTAEVLYPDRLGSFGSDNSNSLVIALEHQGCRILLPGDLESPGLESLLSDTPYDTDVLLAPHHGSIRSDPPGFAAWSQPEQVVISGAPQFSDPRVAATYRHAGAEVLATGEQGAVILRVCRSKITALRSKSWFRPSMTSSE